MEFEYNYIYKNYLVAIWDGDTLTSDFKIIPKLESENIEYEIFEIIDTLRRVYRVSNEFVYQVLESDFGKSIFVWNYKKNEFSSYVNSHFQDDNETLAKLGYHKFLINEPVVNLTVIPDFDTLGYKCEKLKFNSTSKSLSGDEIFYEHEAIVSKQIKFPINTFINNIGYLPEFPLKIISKRAPNVSYLNSFSFRLINRFFDLGKNEVKLEYINSKYIKSKNYLSVEEIIECESN